MLINQSIYAFLVTMRITCKSEEVAKDLKLKPEEFDKNGHVKRPTMHFTKQPAVSASEAEEGSQPMQPASIEEQKEEAQTRRKQVTYL